MVFTGIVENVFSYQINGKKLTLETTSEFVSKVSRGDSVSVNGVCLTLVDKSEVNCFFDLSEETLEKTNFLHYLRGTANVELALRYGDRLGGHLVTGHVHGVGKIESLDQIGNLWISTELSEKLHYKGSVTVNGVSLTVAETTGERFRVALIPETLARTNLWEEGHIVNIELETRNYSSPMQVAFEQAQLGRETAPPNPWVGAVLVKNGVIIGKGYHERPGTRHAEIVAIENALIQGDTLNDTTLYVTLEPCSNFSGKRTPSCAEKIIEYGIKKVVIGCLDPDPRVSGLGEQYLRENGVDVDLLSNSDPQMHTKILDNLKPYIYQRQTGRPWITVKIALTLDNCYVGNSQWITHEASREKLYGIWAQQQAVILGPDTVNIDDPLLTPRDSSNTSLNFRQNFAKIVIDGSRLATDKRIFRDPKCYVVTSYAEKWRHLDVKTIIVEDTHDLSQVITAIDQGLGGQIISILVEGGGRLHQSFFRANLVNELMIFRSSTTAGPNGRPWQMPPMQLELLEQETIRKADETNSWERYRIHEMIRVTDHVENAIRIFQNGGMVIVMDDESRENEGDLIVSARDITVDQMTEMINATTGIICTPMESSRAKQLNLNPMVVANQDNHQTAFTVSVDAATVTTGVSSYDRWQTVKALADPNTHPDDLRRPGHIFPLVARSSLAERRGHTEAGVALCKLAGIYPRVAVIGELKNTDGTMMRLAECQRYGQSRGFPIVTVEELARYEPGIALLTECNLTTQYSEKAWKMQCYDSGYPGRPHKVLIYGDISSGNIPLRVHSECFTGDVLKSQHCDCGNQLHWSMEYIVEKGQGILIYPEGHEGRGIGLVEKVKAYQLQAQGMGTYQANVHLGHSLDARCYKDVLSILDVLGVEKVELLSENPEKQKALGDRVANTVPVLTPIHRHNSKYLKDKLKHFKDEKNSGNLS